MILFDNGLINNEADAYILGFLYADGSLASPYKGQYKAISISLSSKDSEFLKQIAKILDAEIKINKQGKYEVARLYKYCPSTVNALIKFGFTSTKTYDQIDILKHIPEDLTHHFIRGFFDGDGSIYRTDKNLKKCTYGMGFVGMNKILFAQIQEILKKILSREVTLRCEKKRYFRINIKGNPSLILIKSYLYKDATLFLKRKKDLFDRLAIYIGKNGMTGLRYSPSKRTIKKWTAHYNKKYLGLFLTKQEAIDSIKESKYEHSKSKQS